MNNFEINMHRWLKEVYDTFRDRQRIKQNDRKITIPDNYNEFFNIEYAKKYVRVYYLPRKNLDSNQVLINYKRKRGQDSHCYCFVLIDRANGFIYKCNNWMIHPSSKNAISCIYEKIDLSQITCSGVQYEHIYLGEATKKIDNYLKSKYKNNNETFNLY